MAEFGLPPSCWQGSSCGSFCQEKRPRTGSAFRVQGSRLSGEPRTRSAETEFGAPGCSDYCLTDYCFTDDSLPSRAQRLFPFGTPFAWGVMNGVHRKDVQLSLYVACWC